MDPDVALEQIRKCVGSIRNLLDAPDAELEQLNIEADLDALVLHWGGLDEWLSNGGFLPTPWHANVRHS